MYSGLASETTETLWILVSAKRNNNEFSNLKWKTDFHSQVLILILNAYSSFDLYEMIIISFRHPI